MRKSTVILIYASAAVMASGIGVIFPLLAQLQEHVGASTAQLGLIASASFAAALVAQLALSPLGDKGRLPLLMTAGLAFAAAALVIIGLATTSWLLLCGRIVEGLGWGMFSPAARSALAADDPDAAGSRLGKLSAFELGGMIAAPLLGTLAASHISLSAPFILVAGGCALAATLLWRADLPASANAGTNTGSNTGSNTGTESVEAPNSTLNLLKRPGIVAALLIGLGLLLPVGVYDAIWARYVEDLGGSTFLVGVSMAAYALPFAVLAPVGGKLSDRFRPIRVSVVGLLWSAPFILAYGLAATPVPLVVLGVIEPIGHAAAVPGALTTAAAGLTAAIAGWMYSGWGPEWLFGMTAAAVVICTLGALAIDVHLARREPATRAGTEDKHNWTYQPPPGV